MANVGPFGHTLFILTRKIFEAEKVSVVLLINGEQFELFARSFIMPGECMLLL